MPRHEKGPRRDHQTVGRDCISLSASARSGDENVHETLAGGSYLFFLLRLVGFNTGNPVRLRLKAKPTKK